MSISSDVPVPLHRGLNEVDDCVTSIRSQTALRPQVAIILGSGLGPLVDLLQDRLTIPYAALPHFPTSSVVGHAGQLHFGNLDGVDVVAMQGRVHAYEGYSPAQVAFPSRVLCRLRPQVLVVTNAAGGIDPHFAAGSLMCITDHINLSGIQPLVGPNDERLGPRFPDMTTAYSFAHREVLYAVAQEHHIPLHRGVYAMMLGPTYETPAEVRLLRTLGAHAVGMSTVPEVIVARHMGIPVVGLSVISNLAAGMSGGTLSHDEVATTAGSAFGHLSTLLRKALPRFVSVVNTGQNAD